MIICITICCFDNSLSVLSLSLSIDSISPKFGCQSKCLPRFRHNRRKPTTVPSVPTILKLTYWPFLIHPRVNANVTTAHVVSGAFIGVSMNVPVCVLKLWKIIDVLVPISLEYNEAYALPFHQKTFSFVLNMKFMVSHCSSIPTFTYCCFFTAVWQISFFLTILY